MPYKTTKSSIAGLAMDPFFILDTGAAATDYGGKSSEGFVRIHDSLEGMEWNRMQRSLVMNEMKP